MATIERNILWLWQICLCLTIASSQGNLCSGPNGETQIYVQNIPENWPVNTTLVHLYIVGDDTEIKLEEMGRNEYVRLDPGSRNVTLIKALNAEQFTEIKFEIKCEILSGVAQGLQINIPVRILILDVNDNAPVFLQASYSAEVNELSPVGTTIITGIRASDADTDNWYITYQIVPGAFSDYFTIPLEAQGTLVLGKPLDYETRSRMQVTVMAKDNHPPVLGVTQPRLNSTTQVIINITDGDDQNPTFKDGPYLASILENSTLGTPVKFNPPVYAYDLDFGINSSVRYDIVPDASNGESDYFSIQDTTGVMSVAKTPIGRDYKFSLLIQATQTDNADRYTTTLARVLVQRANENAPTFLKRHYTVNVVENVPIATKILTMTAHDNDPGAILTFQFPSPHPDFEMDSKTGEIYTRRPLDYETTQHYNITAQVSDGLKSDFALVTINIVNVNDNSPVFSQPQYQFEADRKGEAYVGTVTATDQDLEDQVFYSIQGNTTQFQVQQNGEIYMTDRETLTETRYTLVVVATDTLKPSRQGVAMVTVKFEADSPEAAAAGRSQSDLVVIIILAILCGCLTIALIAVMIWAYRSHSPPDKHMVQSPSIESNLNLSQSSQKPFYTNPEGLTYRPSDTHTHLYDNMHMQDADATTTQENPFETGNHYVYGFDNLSDSSDPAKIYSTQSRQMAPVSEIEYDTAIAPMDNGQYVTPDGTPVHMNDSLPDSLPSSSSSAGSFNGSGSTQKLVDSSGSMERGGVSAFTGTSQTSMYDSKGSTLGRGGTNPATGEQITVYF